MKIICPFCKRTYNVPEERLPDPVSKASCSECGSVLLINKETGEIEGDTTPGKISAEPRMTSAVSEPDKPAIMPEALKGEGGRDYLAIGVFVAGLILLIVTGYFAIGRISPNDIPKAVKSFSQRFLDVYISEKVHKDRPGKMIQPMTPAAREFQRYLSIGHSLFRGKRFDEAIEEYTKAIKIQPRNYVAHYWRGRAYSQKGEREKAIEDYKRTIELNPSYPHAYDNLGWLYTQMAKWDESIKYLDKAIELSPQNGWAYYNRGRCYYNRGDLGKALEDAKMACDLGYKDGCKVYQGLKK